MSTKICFCHVKSNYATMQLKNYNKLPWQLVIIDTHFFLSFFMNFRHHLISYTMANHYDQTSFVAWKTYFIFYGKCLLYFCHGKFLRSFAIFVGRMLPWQLQISSRTWQTIIFAHGKFFFCTWQTHNTLLSNHPWQIV